MKTKKGKGKKEMGGRWKNGGDVQLLKTGEVKRGLWGQKKKTYKKVFKVVCTVPTLLRFSEDHLAQKSQSQKNFGSKFR